MTIRITNLARKATEDDLLELFNQFGEVKSVTIVKDKITGKSKGFGFIEMKSKTEGNEAITNLNKKKIMGEKLTVKEVK